MIIITGSYAPDVCGVGDFVAKLVLRSNSEFIKAKTVKDFFGLARLTLHRKDILLEYPTQGYGWSVLPHLFTFFRWLIAKPIVIQLHEFKYQSFKNKLASYIFLIFSSKIIVTNQEEFSYVNKIFNKKTTIIPIFSNVTVLNNKNIIRDIDLIYFGQIRPNKGIEQFILESGKLVDINVKIIGAVPSFCRNYADSLIKSTNIEFITNRSLEEVSRYLSRARCAYLPFPDGASFRRGSLLACLEHGVKILSNKGLSSDDLEDYIYFNNEYKLLDFINFDNKKDMYYPLDENEIVKKIENVVR